jgi:DNA mismatch repair protein MutL
MIQVLDQKTIDKIAAGEVVERPASVVKELVENSIDSGATAITVEIKEGGISLIRVTDNGCGIPAEQVPIAFLRHATSKITSIEDLLTVRSLGFRGEALSSIAAVGQVELITKTGDAMTGLRYEIHGGIEQNVEEIGCPEGTTFIVRNLFYNTPARRKFLKTAMTEGNYVSELVEQIAMSHPDISFKFVNNGQNKLSTSGNGSLKDILYHIYGRDIATNLLPIEAERNGMKISGYVAKPYISRGNRSFEHYFVNGRYIKSPIITKAIEEAYKTFVMIHKFPFVAIYLTVDSKLLDVNVHPRKMEMRYSRGDELYKFIFEEIRYVLLQKELIPEVSQTAARKKADSEPPAAPSVPEPFETNRRKQESVYSSEKKDNFQSFYGLQNETPPTVHEKEAIYQATVTLEHASAPVVTAEHITSERITSGIEASSKNPSEKNISVEQPSIESLEQTSAETGTPEPEVQSNIRKDQISLFESGFMTEEARPKHRLIGQLFKTYWLIEYENNLFIMDQHAAHEKVMYEKLMKQYEKREILSQQIHPPLVISVNLVEQEALRKNMDFFEQMGFQIESFGGNEYMLRAVPLETYGLAAQDIFIDFVDSLTEEGNHLNIDLFIYKIATMACKAAVKGNMKLSFAEADALIDQLLQLDNPYNCPHGRPTIIAMTETELEKKFRRIQN